MLNCHLHAPAALLIAKEKLIPNRCEAVWAPEPVLMWWRREQFCTFHKYKPIIRSLVWFNSPYSLHNLKIYVINRTLEFSFRRKLNINCDTNPDVLLPQIDIWYRLFYPSYMPLLRDATAPLTSHLAASGRPGIMRSVCEGTSFTFPSFRMKDGHVF